MVKTLYLTAVPCSRAREILGFAGSGPICETEKRFISRQKAEKWSIQLCILKILQYTD